MATQIAEKEGVEITRTLLDGKAYQKILDHARKTNPWLLVTGRIGVHSEPGESGLGSNTENLLRAAPCDVLITTRLEYPELDIQAQESIRWTPEAEERMTRVPPQVSGIARTAIYRMAVEKGHSVITSDLLDEAMDRFMPKSSAAATEKLAESLVLQAAAERNVSICKKCGLAATEPEPVKCSVCSHTLFEVVTPDMVQAIIASEGGAQAEDTYDGRTLRWTRDAKRALWVFDNAYQRRRTKARIEKMARMRRMQTVTLEFARNTIEEESGKPLVLPEVSGDQQEAPAPAAEATGADGRRLIARDSRNTPLVSTFKWTDDAIKRVLRVPGGFMRDRTQNRIEEVAHERQAQVIDLDLVEAGIEHSRQLMAQMVESYQASPEVSRAEMEEERAGAGDRDDGEPTQPLALNEIGVMAAVQRARKDSIN